MRPHLEKTKNIGRSDNPRKRLAVSEFPVAALDYVTIAAIDSRLIECMTKVELVCIIRLACLPSFADTEIARKLPFYDIDTLRRLGQRARQCCFLRAQSLSLKGESTEKATLNSSGANYVNA
jgi:hypothetical protein